MISQWIGLCASALLPVFGMFRRPPGDRMSRGRVATRATAVTPAPPGGNSARLPFPPFANLKP